MSYILDALKKMEHEKIKKDRGAGMTSITGELFSNDQQPGDAAGKGRIVLVTVFVALITFGATWFFLKPDKQGGSPRPSATVPVSKIKTSPPSLPVPAPVKPLQPQAAAVAHTTAPVPLPVSPPPAKPAPVASSVPAAIPVAREPKRKTTIAAKPPVQSAEDAAALITVQELRKRMKVQKGPVATTIAPPADIKLSGIAWQEDHRARRAVLNGFLMQEGGIVSGARITEILQDRVRFSLSGSVFEISLAESAGMSPSGK